VLRLRAQGGRATLFADERELAGWEAHGDGVPGLELARSGSHAFAVIDGLITAVRLADGGIVARAEAGRGVSASIPLDGRWTLEVAGELAVDGGHTGFHSRGTGFFWLDGGEGIPTREERGAEVARARAELAAAARQPLRRRWVVRDAAAAVVLHDVVATPAEGGEVLLWPPIAGPDGVLLRHSLLTDSGSHADEEPQRPWLVRGDGIAEQLPFELGVSPLLALPGERWLLPGWDTVWRDDCDEPLSVLDADGRIGPWLVSGCEVRPSGLLQDVAPELLRATDPSQDVPWEVAG
jgi:hypothetical protein